MMRLETNLDLIVFCVGCFIALMVFYVIGRWWTNRIDNKREIEFNSCIEKGSIIKFLDKHSSGRRRSIQMDKVTLVDHDDKTCHTTNWGCIQFKDIIEIL